MTFSEIGPWLAAQRNAFDRCLSLQLHKSGSAECEWGAALKEPAVVVFRAELSGEYQVLPVIAATSPLSKHLATRTHTQGGEARLASICRSPANYEKMNSQTARARAPQRVRSDGNAEENADFSGFRGFYFNLCFFFA